MEQGAKSKYGSQMKIVSYLQKEQQTTMATPIQTKKVATMLSMVQELVQLTKFL